MPDVPAENYWYRRHLAVYEWIAERCNGLEVVDMACGEGYGTDVLARRARGVTGVDANPEAHEHARLKYTAARRPLRARPGGELPPAGRRRGVPADDRARGASRGGADALPLAAEARRRGVPLHAERAHAGPARAPSKSDNPLHLREYRAEEFRALCASVFEQGGDVRALPRAQAPRCTSWPCVPAGTARTPRSASPSRSTTASPPPSTPATSPCAPADLERALDFVAVLR